MDNLQDSKRQQVFQVIEEFGATALAQDIEGHAGTFNFPHVRVTGSKVAMWSNIGELRQHYLPALAVPGGLSWSYTVFDRKDIIQTDGDTFHVAVTFTRYDRDDTAVGTYQALYVVTCVNGHWGLQARCSLVPASAEAAALSR